jgi:hypothetical protein
MMTKRAWAQGVVVLGSMVLAAASACISSKSPSPAVTPPATTPPGTSSGSLGVVVIDGTQKLYLPTAKLNAAGHNVVSVVNVGLDGNGVNGVAALITDIDLGTTIDHPILAAGDTTMILVGSGVSQTIWIINPQNDTLIKTIQLDPSTQKTTFSTPDGYMNGIAVDSAHRKAYISIWNGFAVFDMNAMAITSTILLNPTENFSFDTVHQKLYSPFYNCPDNGGEDSGPPASCATTLTDDDAGGVMNSGLDVVDLSDNTVYTYQDPTAQDPTQPFGSSPDSTGVDPSTQIVFLPDEFGNQFALDFSKAVFDKATKSVTAPHEMMAAQMFDGVAIETTKHYGFWEHEYADNVAVLNLAGFTVGAGVDASDGENEAVPGFLSSTMPDTPAMQGGQSADTSWTNSGDPHGVAVATGIKDGKSVAFLVDYPNNNWIARIDLEMMSTIKGATPGTLTPQELAPAVTYLDTLTLVGADAGDSLGVGGDQ